MLRPIFAAWSLSAVVALSACSSATGQGPDDEQVGRGQDGLACSACVGGGGGGWVFDPGPTYCPAVNPSCTIASRAFGTLDCNVKGCLSTWCRSPKSYTLPGYLPMNAADCPDTLDVRRWASYENSIGRGTVFTTTACDKCLPRPDAGRGYVITIAVSGPTCGSGCIPPW